MLWSAISRAKRRSGRLSFIPRATEITIRYADCIGKAIDMASLEYTAHYSKELGVHLDLRYVPFTSHVPFGKVVSATPNGRKA